MSRLGSKSPGDPFVSCRDMDGMSLVSCAWSDVYPYDKALRPALKLSESASHGSDGGSSLSIIGIDSLTPSSDFSISGDCGAGLCGGGWKTCGCKSCCSGSGCAVGGVRMKLPGRPNTGDSSKSVTADAGCPRTGTDKLDV